MAGDGRVACRYFQGEGGGAGGNCGGGGGVSWMGGGSVLRLHPPPVPSPSNKLFLNL